jgi:hypothetical protein
MRTLGKFLISVVLLVGAPILTLGAAASVLHPSLSRTSTPQTAPKDKRGTDAAPAGTAVPDKGKYRILLDGQVVGQEDFEISSAGSVWTAHGSTTMHAPGAGAATATGTLKFSADGSPIHYEWSTQTQKKASGAVEFAGGKAKTSVDLGGSSPYAQDFVFPSTRIAILDNNLYDQYAVLTRLYDWKAGGKQSFPVLIPQAVTPGTIDVESLGPQQVEGENYDAVRVSSPDLEIMLYFDASRRLIRLEVPASKVIIQRE